MDYLLARLKEESTWRGIIAVTTAVLTSLGATGTVAWLQSPEKQGAIISAGLGLIGLINIIKKQTPPPPTTPPTA